MVLRIARPRMKKISLRAGGVILSNDVFEEANVIANEFVDSIIKAAAEYAKHCKRRTLNVSDIKEAARFKKITCLGLFE